MTDTESTTDTETVLDPGMVHAGATAAARRRELNISQRSLAADGVINAGALIAFEKGRSWPRERTRARLEHVLQWPPGTIARLRHDTAPTTTRAAAPEPTSEPAPTEVSLVAQAVVTGVHGLGAAIDALPAVDAPDFTPRVTAILSDLRQLETIAAGAARISTVTPPLIKALSTVRRPIHELTLRAATAPGATLGQRLYATRRRANLTIGETAQAAGVPEDTVADAEAERPLPADATAAIAALIEQLD